MRILVTGASGFVGRHLCQHLLAQGDSIQIFGTCIQNTAKPDGVTWHVLDLRDAVATRALVAETRPDAIYHLAAQASVDDSFKDAWGTIENNIRAQLNLFEACIALNAKPRLLIVTSAEIYGRVRSEELPITEDTPLRPANPYSVSKATQDLLGLQYFFSHQLPIIRVRPFNHIGAGQSERFVATAFGLQIARIEQGLQEPIIHVGNLEALRDFTDVRDVVSAYALLMQKGEAGTAYNVASGRSIRVSELLEGLLALSPVAIKVEIDPARLRPIDLPIISVACKRLQEATGWQPQIPLEMTLRDILNDCRQRVQNTH